MKRLLLCVLALDLAGCLDQAKSAEQSTPAERMILTSGCTISKVKNNVTINCADGSSAGFTTASPYYVKDANSVEYPNLRFMGNGLFYNTDTGHILEYNSGSGAMTGATTLYFESLNCTGNVFTSIGSQFSNQIFANLSGAPGFPAVMTTGAPVVGQAGLSYFSNGTCTNLASNELGNVNMSAWGGGSTSWLKVVSATMDSVPSSFAMPISMEISQ